MDPQIRSIDDLMIDALLAREGDRFTDDPTDCGGATKYGITQKSWESNAWRTQRPTLSIHVRDLTEPEARAFYLAIFLAPLKWITDLDLRELVFDTAVQHGANRAIKWLQSAAGCIVIDGYLGPETRFQVQQRDPRDLYAAVLVTRLKFYAQIATDQPPADPNAKFLRGWINRICEFIR